MSSSRIASILSPPVKHTILRPAISDSALLLDYVLDRAARHVPADAADVLDAGSGTGRAIPRLVPRRRLVALDLQPRGPHPNRIAADLRRMPFPDGAFDAVVCINVLPGVTWSVAREGMRDMVRVLRPGGTLVLTSQNLDHPLYRVRSLLWRERTGSTWTCGIRESWLRSWLDRIELFEWVLPRSSTLAEAYAAVALRIPRLCPHLICVARRPPIRAPDGGESRP